MKLLNNKGYTLVEVITTVTLLLIVITPLTVMFNMWYENFFEDNDEVYLQQKARDIMGYIVQDLRRYSTLNTACINNNKSIYISDEIIYEYDDIAKKLFKNGDDVIDKENIEMNQFNAIEVNEEGSDSEMIQISFKLVSNNETEINMNTVFRRRISN